MCLLSLASCGQNISKEAAEKGKGYFDSGDYETAAKAFGVAIQNGNTDSEISLLYDITLKYHQANTAFEEEKYETAKDILDSIDSKYENYGIRENILTLKHDVEKILDSEELLLDIASAIEKNSFDEATALTNDVDVNSLTAEQLKRFNKYKSEILSAEVISPEIPQIPEEPQTEVIPETPPADNTTVSAPETAVSEPQIPEQKKPAQEKASKEKTTPKKPVQQKTTQEKAPQQPAPQQPAPQQSAPQQPAPQPVYVQPAINTNVANDVYIYPTDTTLLTAEQLATLSKNDIALIRNEIYARKGHIFTTSTYQNYFAQKTWYVPTASVRWTDLNEIEKANIRLIKEFEKNN